MILLHEISWHTCYIPEEFCAREASQILGGRSYLRGNHIGGRIERCWREARDLGVTVLGTDPYRSLVKGHQSFALFRFWRKITHCGREGLIGCRFACMQLEVVAASIAWWVWWVEWMGCGGLNLAVLQLRPTDRYQSLSKQNKMTMQKEEDSGDDGSYCMTF